MTRRPRYLALAAVPTLPGLAVVAAGTAVAFAVDSACHHALAASTIAVALGAALTNLRGHRPMLETGTRFAAHHLLRIAIVLLGLQLALPQLISLGIGGMAVVIATVTVTFLGTLAAGRLIGVTPSRTLLVATGFSICGASAVAAMSQVAEHDEDDPAIAVALVTLCGSLAILVWPLLRAPLGLDVTAFGTWVGASIQDVGQTVATADRVTGSATAAVVVKLSRVILLAPLVTVVGVRARSAARRRGERPIDGKRPPIVPLFVAGFLGAIGLASTGWLPLGVLAAAQQVQSVLLVAALFGLGTGIDVAAIRRTGGPAVVLGLVAWALVAGTALVGVKLLGV